jgi:hypothetical protein
MHMKTKYTLFRRNGIYYSQDSATGQQKSLRTRDEADALKLLNARNEAHRQPVLNLHLARAYLTASDPAFVARTWQTVMEQLQRKGSVRSIDTNSALSKKSSRHCPLNSPDRLLPLIPSPHLSACTSASRHHDGRDARAAASDRAIVIASLSLIFGLPRDATQFNHRVAQHARANIA